MIAGAKREVVCNRDFGCYLVDEIEGVVARCGGWVGRMFRVVPKLMRLFASTFYGRSRTSDPNSSCWRSHRGRWRNECSWRKEKVIRNRYWGDGTNRGLHDGEFEF